MHSSKLNGSEREIKLQARHEEMKASRSRLFPRGVMPSVRFFEPEDTRWIWSDHAMRAPNADTSLDAQHLFTDMALHELSKFGEVFVIEDDYKQFSTGRCPVGLMTADLDAWTIRPHAYWFKWAQARHKVRGTVAYLLRRVRSNDLGGNVGLCEINANAENAPFFKAISRYITVKQGPIISHGRLDGSAHLFHVRGKRKQERSHDRH